MSRKSHHVVPNKTGGWDIKKGGGKKSIKHFDKKGDAINYGRRISKNQRSEFIIHNKDGFIINSDSHGSDTCPPKDMTRGIRDTVPPPVRRPRGR